SCSPPQLKRIPLGHAPSPVMHPQLAALVGQLEAVTARASELGATLDDTAFQARPPSAGWSAAECIAHLSLTTVALLPRLDAALATRSEEHTSELQSRGH